MTQGRTGEEGESRVPRQTIRLDHIDAPAVERTLTELAGVRGARVVGSPTGAVESIRILAVPERSTSQVIDDVVNVMRRSGTPITSDAIQVLRVGEALRGVHRRKLSSVSTERSGDRFFCRVSLELAGDVLVGESAAPIGHRSEYRSMARATLDSVARMIDIPAEIENVSILQIGTEKLVVVVLNRAGEPLVGSAMVRVDEYDAIARATLDALNRLLSQLYAGASPPF